MKKTVPYPKTGFLLLMAFLTGFQLCSATPVSAAVDTQPPTVPTKLSSANITHTSISLTWTAASDNTGVKGYHLYRDGKKILTTSKTGHTNNDLVPGRKYSYMVRAYDAAGNVSCDSEILYVSTRGDVEVPTAPGSPAVTSRDHTTITLTWSPSTDNTSIKRYEIYCLDRKIASTSATCYTCKGFTPGQTYIFTVKACDIGGNYSLPSRSITAATLPDLEGPSAPAGLKASSVSGTEIVLAWSPSSDNVKVKSYAVYKDGNRLGSTSRTTYTCKGLEPGKSYTFTVRAYDTVGNPSGDSSPLKTATQKDLEAPSAPTGLKTNPAKGSSVSLSWNASTDNIKVKGYHVYCNNIRVATTTRTGCSIKRPAGFGLDSYHVKAYDLAGNLSPSSNRVTVLKLR